MIHNDQHYETCPCGKQFIPPDGETYLCAECRNANFSVCPGCKQVLYRAQACACEAEEMRGETTNEN